MPILFMRRIALAADLGCNKDEQQEFDVETDRDE